MRRSSRSTRPPKSHADLHHADLQDWLALWLAHVAQFCATHPPPAKEYTKSVRVARLNGLLPPQGPHHRPSRLLANVAATKGAQQAADHRTDARADYRAEGRFATLTIT